MLANRGHSGNSFNTEYVTYKAISYSSTSLSINLFKMFVFVSVITNRAAKGAQARVHEAGRAAKRSEEK